MRASFVEYDNCFRLEVVPETLQEQLALVRLGMTTTKGGSSLFVSVGKETACASVRFKINRRKETYFAK